MMFGVFLQSKKGFIILIAVTALFMFFSASCVKKDASGNSGDTAAKTEQEESSTKANQNTVENKKDNEEISVDNPPSQLIKDYKLPDNTVIELWSIVSNWSSGMDKVQYTVHKLSTESLQELVDYYKEYIKPAYTGGDDNEYTLEGAISDQNCKITIKNKERTILDNTGKEKKYCSEIVTNFPSIEADSEIISLDKIFSSESIDIYNPDSCALIGISCYIGGTELKIYSKDTPEDLCDYYTGKMKSYESFTQTGSKDDFGGNNLLANVQLKCVNKGQEVSVTILKNQNEQTIDQYKTGLIISINQK